MFLHHVREIEGTLEPQLSPWCPREDPSDQVRRWEWGGSVEG